MTHVMKGCDVTQKWDELGTEPLHVKPDDVVEKPCEEGVAGGGNDEGVVDADLGESN